MRLSTLALRVIMKAQDVDCMVQECCADLGSACTGQIASRSLCGCGRPSRMRRQALCGWRRTANTCYWSARERSRVQTTAVPLSSIIVQHNNSTIAGDHTPFEHCRKATMPVSEFKFDEVLRQQSTQGRRVCRRCGAGGGRRAEWLQWHRDGIRPNRCPLPPRQADEAVKLHRDGFEPAAEPTKHAACM